METTKKLKQISIVTAAFSLTISLFFAGLLTGISIAEDVYIKYVNKCMGTENLGLALPYNFRMLSGTYYMVSILILLFIVIATISEKWLAKLINLIPLILLLLQARILLLQPDVLPGWAKEYSSWLEIVYYPDVLMLGFSIILLVLQIYSIRASFRESNIK
jgi:hypothetical protein